MAVVCDFETNTRSGIHWPHIIYYSFIFELSSRLKRKAIVMRRLFDPLDPLWAFACERFFGVCQRHIDPMEPQSFLIALSPPTEWPRKRERTDRWTDGSEERLIWIKLQYNIVPCAQEERAFQARAHL